MISKLNQAKLQLNKDHHQQQNRPSVVLVQFSYIPPHPLLHTQALSNLPPKINNT